MEAPNGSSPHIIGRDARGANVRRALLLGAMVATAACRQVAGIHVPPKPCAHPLMIDDMEDGDPGICQSDGRQGAWFSFGDGTAGNQTLTPNATIDGGRDASRRAAHFTGSGYTDWGAMAGFNLNSQGASRDIYDASNTGAITFWMKTSVALEVLFFTPDTLRPELGGSCVDTATALNCDNNFSFAITAPAESWTQYRVPYTALRQPGDATWKPRELLGILFYVREGAPFDVWIDDVAFELCPGPECAPICNDARLPVVCPQRGKYPSGCFPPDTDCGAIDMWCSDPSLIDDMEDGDGSICDSGGRRGEWWTGSDGTSTDLMPAPGGSFVQTAIPGRRGGSRYAARLTGSGFTDWGAQMDLHLLGRGAPYDASSARGLRFWMKGDAARVLVMLATPPTIPTNDGGTCDGVDHRCWGDFAFDVIPDPDAWHEYQIPFTAFRQLPRETSTTFNLWRGADVLDLSKLVTIKFSVVAGAATPPFEIWVDDLGFYNCYLPRCVPTCHDPGLSVACPASSGRAAGCWPAGTDCASLPDIIRSNGVWGSGPNDVWAVGVSRVTGAGTVLHYDGATWTRSDVGIVPPLRDVTGRGPDDIWMVGDHGTVLRRQGTTWSGATAGTDASLAAVWANSPGDVWALGFPGTVLHWNGAAWSISTSLDQWMVGLWASAPHDLWAVGEGGTILHFDGTAWSPKPSATTDFVNAVWGSGPNDIWAVGDVGRAHFDGTRWAASDGDKGGFLSLWGSGPTDVWAVGYAGRIGHWNGTAWSVLASPVTQDLWDVWGSGSDDVWAVGDGNTIVHFDGRDWRPVAVTWGPP
jgi:hypothetical protein